MTVRKANWTPKSKEEKQKELDDLIALSNKKIEEYKSSPQDMVDYFKFMSKIHNYSPLNVSLIQDQFKGAVAVASYARWQQLGFQVQRGEKGIGVYVHAPVTVFTDESGKEKTLREATPIQKAKIKNGEIDSRVLNHFKKGYVYDVSQTNATAEDLPKIFPNRVWNFQVNEDNLKLLEKGIDDIAKSLNITISTAESHELGVAKGAYKQYLDGKDEIVLNPRNSREQNVATSIHELAHRSLHSKENNPDNSISTGVKEFQAEMTSFVVCYNYGFDKSDYTVPYIASWTKNNTEIKPEEFRKIVKEVKDTANHFIEMIDKNILDHQNSMDINQETAENAQKNSFTIVQNENNKSKEQTQGNTEINNELEQGYKWVIEFNETGEGIPSYTGQTVTPELLETIKGYDQSLPYEQGYYKFYFDKIQDGEVVVHHRIDIGDGLAVNQDFYDFIEKELSQENQVQKEVANEPLRSVVISEATQNINPVQYSDLAGWEKELNNQIDIDSIATLKSCVSVENFYDSHKQEIENIVNDFEAVANMDYRSAIQGDYKENVSTLAYKTVATNIKNEVEAGNFEIPKNKKFEQYFSQTQAVEME